jgi:hypothetical protein
MRLAPHEGRNPRRLHENATSFSCAHSFTTHTQKAVRQDAAFQIRLELVLDELRQTRPGVRFDLREEGLELFLHDPIERRLLRPVPLVGESRARCSAGAMMR